MKKEIAFTFTAISMLILALLGFWFMLQLYNPRVPPPMMPVHIAPIPSQNTNGIPPAMEPGPIGNSDGMHRFPKNCNLVSDDQKTSLDLCNYADLGASTPGMPNPFVLTGMTAAFENQFYYNLVDNQNNIIAQGTAYANSPDVGQPGPFTINGYFDIKPQSRDGVLTLYELSPKDGSKVVLLSTLVHFYPETEKEIQVFFGNNQEDADLIDCSMVYPAKRTQQAHFSTVNVAIHELLLGPSDEETSQGFFSSLPANINDPKVTVKKDQILVDFDETLQQQVGGSCRVIAIREQIKQTVQMNDPYRRNVIISINGQTEDILQP